jgi:hypothetical protein
MKFLVWIGIVLMVLWGALWLGIKMAIASVHLLLIAGLVLVVWGLVHSGRPNRA